MAATRAYFQSSRPAGNMAAYLGSSTRVTVHRYQSSRSRLRWLYMSQRTEVESSVGYQGVTALGEMSWHGISASPPWA